MRARNSRRLRPYSRENRGSSVREGRQPINADGSSNFKANGKAVIPVKFGLASGSGPFAFESIFSNTSTTDDYSFVSFTPTSPLLFSEITELSADYNFTLGDCHQAAEGLRWRVNS